MSRYTPAKCYILSVVYYVLLKITIASTAWSAKNYYGLSKKNTIKDDTVNALVFYEREREREREREPNDCE